MDRFQIQEIQKQLMLPGTTAVVTLDSSQIPKRIMTRARTMLRLGCIAGGGMGARLAEVLNEKFGLEAQRTWSLYAEIPALLKEERATVIEFLQADMAATLLVGKWQAHRVQLQRDFEARRLAIAAGKTVSCYFRDATVHQQLMEWLAGRRSDAIKAKVEAVIAMLEAGDVFTL